MEASGIQFSKEEFSKVFPFFISFDTGLIIQDAGPSMEKIIGVLKGKSFKDVFRIILPESLIKIDFDSLCEQKNKVIVIEAIDFPVQIRFRGQFICHEKKEIVYINSPWIKEFSNLNYLNLDLSDFAIQDVTGENLQLIQSKQVVNEEMKVIADQLTLQRDQLIAKNQEIEELSKYPQQNPQPIIRVNRKGDLLYQNPAALNKIDQKLINDKELWIEMMKEIDLTESFSNRLHVATEIYNLTWVPIEGKEFFNIYFRDITEELGFQEDLLTTNYRLNSLLNTMQSGVLSEDINRNVLHVNSKFCDVFDIKWSPDQLIGQDCRTLLDKAKDLFIDEIGFLADVNALVDEQKPVYGDVLYLKNGKILERDYVPIIENGKFLGQIWRYQDITDIINQKKSLLRIEEKYRRIIEDLEFGLIEVDLDQIITKAYPAFCKLTEYSEEELIGQNAAEILLDPEFEKIIQEQNENRKEGESSVYEIKIRTKSGTPKWLIISGTPIYNERNEIIGSIGIHIDITERRHLEDALKLANEKANSSVKAKELFIANMSHEIRTPMNVILGMTELLRSSNNSVQDQKYLRAINNSAENLLRLINEILDISKIESGTMNLFEETHNIQELFEDLETSFTEHAKKKNISFDVNIDSRIYPYLKCDVVKLNQVLVNLIGNAIKFTNSGKVILKVSLVEDNIADQLVQIEVTDTGIGINKENFQLIFESFIQEDASIFKNFGGTGLGLAISQAIVNKMGGTIEVQSELGKGSTFSFRVKWKKDNNTLVNEVIKSEELMLLKSKRVLIAEDNTLNQQLISAIFEKENLSCVIAENGEKVIELLSMQSFDIILMDIQMPGMDGMATTKFIREVLNLSIPIIALTANESEDNNKLYSEIGMTGFLPKPFKIDQLLRVMINQFGEFLNENNNQNKAIEVEQFSLKNLVEMSGGDKEFILSIIQTFLGNVPNYVDQLKLAFDKQDFKQVNRFAHQMKPSIDVFDINDLKKVIRFIESEAIKDDLDKEKIGQEISFVGEKLNEIYPHMQAIINKGAI
jgi:PAS domain S-box-containing protein